MIADTFQYRDRLDAGQRLANELSAYKDMDAVVLAVPRGGVPVAWVVAKELHLPLDIVLSKKIGHPLQKEYAIGAASLTDSFIADHEDVPRSYIEEEIRTIQARLKEMYEKFRDGRPPIDVSGKIVIIIDDGIATGNTILSTVRMIRKQSPAKVVVATPVASEGAIEKLSGEVDEMVCPLVPYLFFGVGQFYEDFEQTSDEEVKSFLDNFHQHESQ